MKKAHVTVKGTRPVLFHSFNVEVISSLTKKKSGSSGNNSEEWKDTVLERGGQLYFPATYWQATLKEGAKYTKAGRGTMQKTFNSASMITTDYSMIDRHLPNGWVNMTVEEFGTDASRPVYIDVRGVMNPATKGRNVRYRVACSPGWKCAFEIEFDDNYISTQVIKKIVEDAGKMVGIADGRTLGNGRFEVESCEID